MANLLTKTSLTLTIKLSTKCQTESSRTTGGNKKAWSTVSKTKFPPKKSISETTALEGTLMAVASTKFWTRSKRYSKLVRDSLFQHCLHLDTRMKMTVRLLDRNSTKIKSRCTMEVTLMRGKLKSGKLLRMEVKGGRRKTTGLLLHINYAKDRHLLKSASTKATLEP